MKKPYICTFAIPMATKLGRVVTYGGGTPPNYSGDLLMMWSRENFETF